MYLPDPYFPPIGHMDRQAQQAMFAWVRELDVRLSHQVRAALAQPQQLVSDVTEQS